MFIQEINEKHTVTKACIVLCVIFFSFFILASTYADVPQPDDPVRQFLAQQKVIRIFADGAPGYGDQVASVALITRLRNSGFTGKFQFYYAFEAKSKIIALFNLPEDMSDNYEDQKKNIQFIAWSYDEMSPDQEKLELKNEVTLGIAGAMEFAFDKCNPDFNYSNDDPTPLCNFARIFNVKYFIEWNPYYFPAASFDEHPDILLPAYRRSVQIKIYSQDQTEIQHQAGSESQFIVTPVTTLADAKNYLTDDPSGKKLIEKDPALNTFIDAIESKSINMLPVYGYTLQEMDIGEKENAGHFPANILQIITAARYAQQNGGTENFHKPLIIAVFYNYDKENTLLDQLIHQDNWQDQPGLSSYFTNNDGIENLQRTIKKLQLQEPGVFSVASLSNPKTIDMIKNLHADQILVLSMGVLPTTVFNGIYTDINDNKWPAIHEGANSFNILSLTGKPFFTCQKENADFLWGKGLLANTDPALIQQFNSLYSNFCNGMQAWQTDKDLYQRLGQLIIDANNPASSLTHYFEQIREEALKPENDRIYQGLKAVQALDSAGTSAMPGVTP